MDEEMSEKNKKYIEMINKILAIIFESHVNAVEANGILETVKQQIVTDIIKSDIVLSIVSKNIEEIPEWRKDSNNGRTL